MLIPGVLAPTPSQLQHAYPLLPFMFLVVVYVFAAAPVPPTARWTRLTGAALIIAAATHLPVNFQRLPSVLIPSHWTPMREHVVGERIKAATGPGALVLTTTPIDPIEGGLRVYPEFATGVFAWILSHEVGQELMSQVLLLHLGGYLGGFAAEIRFDGEHLPVERVSAGVRPAVDFDVNGVTAHGRPSSV